MIAHFNHPDARILAVIGLAVTLSIQAETLPPVVRPADASALESAVRELIEHHAQEVEKRPSDAAAHAELGLVYEANLLWSEARASFANAVQLAPKDVLWRFHLALATDQSGDFEEALAQLETLAEEVDDFPALQQRLGQARLEKGDLDMAKAAFDRLIELLPENVVGYVGRGDALLRLGRTEAAVADLEKAVALAPGYRTAHYLLGTAYLRLGRRDEAQRELARGVDGDLSFLPDPLSARIDRYAVNLTARLSQAGNLLAAGQAEHAATLLEEAQRHHPDDTTVLNNLAVAYLRLGRLDDAESRLLRSKELDPKKFSTYLNLVSWALRSRQLDKALEYARSAVAAAPQMAQPYYTQAQVLANLGRFEEALASLQQSLLRDARNPAAHTFSGDLAMRLERFAAAREHYRQALELEAGFLPARVGLGEASVALGDAVAARQALDAARRLAPGHPLVRRLEERLAGSSGEVEKR